MIVKPGALARRAARALTAGAVIAGGVFIATPAHAVLPLPTITAVAVVGNATSKVVTAGTTIQITGTGFTGMTDNAAVASCTSTAAAAYPLANSGCSQVRFLGKDATGTTNFTVATRYNVVNDTTIYANVPSIAAADGAAGGPAAGTGSIKVQVLNTMGTGTSSLQSTSAASELFYRKPLTAALAGTTTANPNGGGVVPVTLSGGIAALSTTTLPQEKLTAYVVSSAAGSPTVPAGPITFKDATTINVTLPPNAAQGNVANVMVVHDGIPGTADTTNLTYPAVITKLENCGATDVSPVPDPLPTTCTGPATAPSSGAAEFKVTGKGLTGATTWDWDGPTITTDGTHGTEYSCTVVTDSLAFCSLTIHTVPSPPVVSVTFTPVDPDAALSGPATVPVLAPTSGGVIIYGTLV